VKERHVVEYVIRINATS